MRQALLERTSMKMGVVVATITLALMCCFAVGTQSAWASTPWNPNVTVTANAVPTTDDANQTIDVTMEFASANLSSVTSASAQTYLQAHTSIAGRNLDGSNYSTYKRTISNVSISGNTITFTIGPNSNGMTANYNAQLLIAADENSTDSLAIAMGKASVETLINTGLAVSTVNSADNTSATVAITSNPGCRSMNFVLFYDGTNYIFADGTSADGHGLTIHSHSFTEQTAKDYATALVTAANNAGAANLGYTFTDNGDGTLTITKTDGSAMSGIDAVVYNGDYLNEYGLAVGTTTEKPMVND